MTNVEYFNINMGIDISAKENIEQLFTRDMEFDTRRSCI